MEISNELEKAQITETILRQLPDWFGIESAIKEYTAGVRSRRFFAAKKNQIGIGFFAGEIHYGHTGVIYLCALAPDDRGRGLGRSLYEELEGWFRAQHCDRVLVKTLSAAHPSPAYAATRAFYRKMGFRELLDLPELWGENNPCLLMEKSIQ